MLLHLLDILARNPALFFAIVGAIALALAVAITVHEFSHALVAHRLGDPTARSLGRLSLNPLAHLDPLGTLMLFLVGFGWGKPVPVNPHWLRTGLKSGMALVSLAGPAANLITAGLVAVPIKLGLLAWHSPFLYPLFSQTNPSWIVADLVGYIIFYNLILAVFNLIPLAPLDGFKVAVGLLPGELSDSYARLERYGPMILLLIIGADYFFNTRFLWGILGPAVEFFGSLLVGRRIL